MNNMTVNELLNGVHCTCGRHHTCSIEKVYIEENAIRHLTDLCADVQRVLLVADENTFAAAGAQTEKALCGKEIRKQIFDGSAVLVPDERAIAAVESVLGDAQTIVAIGSGVMQDLCKYISHVHGVPYIVVATAPSMDGYASDGAAMITGGMKTTFAAGLPRAILADVDVLRNAPLDMIKAGYGDVIGKYSALNDWKLSRLVNDEYFCEYIYDLTMDKVLRTEALADGLLRREAQSVQALMEALVVIGILMSFAGSSRPASGSEHHLSHFFEITGIVKNRPYFPHGIDVAYSTVITAELRELLLTKTFPQTAYREPRAEYEENVRRVYGKVGDGCIALQDKMGRYTRDTAPVYREKETAIRAVLSEMPTAEEIRKRLALVELDMAEFYDLYGQQTIDDAVMYAKDLKDRYTVLWMYYDFLK
ncbi:MAG: sn-glycerol-1-phosphate dehydrogenase [Clostridia bacterium]|nr:sn-glycerol-1-phosphate dehydrogenase [Clostridia bacterium]